MNRVELWDGDRLVSSHPTKPYTLGRGGKRRSGLWRWDALHTVMGDCVSASGLVANKAAARLAVESHTGLSFRHAFRAKRDKPVFATDPRDAFVTIRLAGERCGSGVVVGRCGENAVVLTCFHVVRYEGPLQVERADATCRARVVSWLRPVLDVALMVCRGLGDAPAAKLATTEPTRGGAVCKVGSATGFMTGRVLDRYDNRHATSDLTSLPGDSGSGVFNDRGELVGLTRAYIGVHNRTLYINRQSLSEYLDPLVDTKEDC